MHTYTHTHIHTYTHTHIHMCIPDAIAPALRFLHLLPPGPRRHRDSRPAMLGWHLKIVNLKTKEKQNTMSKDKLWTNDRGPIFQAQSGTKKKLST